MKRANPHLEARSDVRLVWRPTPHDRLAEATVVPAAADLVEQLSIQKRLVPQQVTELPQG